MHQKRHPKPPERIQPRIQHFRVEKLGEHGLNVFWGGEDQQFGRNGEDTDLEGGWGVVAVEAWGCNQDSRGQATATNRCKQRYKVAGRSFDLDLPCLRRPPTVSVALFSATST